MHMMPKGATFEAFLIGQQIRHIRILQINELRAVTKEVIEAAREQLVIGPV